MLSKNTRICKFQSNSLLITVFDVIYLCVAYGVDVEESLNISVNVSLSLELFLMLALFIGALRFFFFFLFVFDFVLTVLPLFQKFMMESNKEFFSFFSSGGWVIVVFCSSKSTVVSSYRSMISAIHCVISLRSYIRSFKSAYEFPLFECNSFYISLILPNISHIILNVIPSFDSIVWTYVFSLLILAIDSYISYL